MKSDKRTDAVISKVESMINKSGLGINHPAMREAFATYHALRWARGMKEKDPLIGIHYLLDPAGVPHAR